jgi:hypothetical protein
VSAGFEAFRRLRIKDNGWDAFQVVIKRTEMIQCVNETDETRAYRAEISGFDGERFEEVLDLLYLFDRRVVIDGFTAEPPTDCVDCAMSNLQYSPPRLKRDRHSRFGKGGIEGG